MTASSIEISLCDEWFAISEISFKVRSKLGPGGTIYHDSPIITFTPAVSTYFGNRNLRFKILNPLSYYSLINLSINNG